MATLTQGSYFTIADLTKQIDPKGNIAIIAETLSEMNEFLETAVMAEANQSFSDTGTKRIKLPAVTPRLPNAGATTGYGETSQIREGIMLFDALIQIDEVIADHAPNRDQLRRNILSEQLEAYMQEFSRILCYGNSADPKEIDGFLTRYNDLSDSNVRGAGGTGSDLSSVLMVEWNPVNAKLIYPMGSKTAGINEEDLAKQLVTDSNNNSYRAYVNQVKMEFGLSILDDKYVSLIRNIEVSGTTNNLIATNGMNDMVYAKNALKHVGRNAKIYVNRSLKSQFDIWALDKANGFYLAPNVSGMPPTTFQGMFIHMVDELIDTEPTIT